MNLAPLARAITLATAGSVLLAIPSLASAAFIEDSTASLGFRNLYMNQDTRNKPSIDAKTREDNRTTHKTKEEWSQAFILDYKSGFTEGTVGVGVDIYAATAIKLDSGPYRTPNSFPQRKSNGKTPSSFGKPGTFKAKIRDGFAGGYFDAALACGAG